MLFWHRKNDAERVAVFHCAAANPVKIKIIGAEGLSQGRRKEKVLRLVVARACSDSPRRLRDCVLCEDAEVFQVSEQALEFSVTHHRADDDLIGRRARRHVQNDQQPSPLLSGNERGTP